MKKIWIITPKTNLHVGDENSSSYGLIDLAIQRNPITTLPCIHSSSLKGAIKEYVANNSNLDLKYIFGSAKKSKEEDKDLNKEPKNQKGVYTFFDAELIAIPKPCCNSNKGYRLCLCENALDEFLKKANLLGCKYDRDAIITAINPDKPDPEAPMTMDKFVEICDDDSLPIIARNVLENGESKNLWYEQVLPPESVLITMIDDGKDDGKDDSKDDSLCSAINGEIIQVGANATIGYGYCEFKTV